ncbi:MAG: MBL fold metallo-hydrolase, partial [Clostridia bacterium]|nr:MBL fold metallo-hydrolase [Clostridia bacterium]
MTIKTFVLGLLSNNTYLVINEQDKSCFLVDLSTPSKELAEYIESNGLKLEGILLTHGHFDHIGGVKFFTDKFGGKVYMHGDDVDFIENPLKIGRKFDKFTPDVLVNDGDELVLCGSKIKVVHTPGHSLGGVCYILDNIIFCGDTIFKGSYGRTDLRGGDFKQLYQSVNKILNMQGDYILLSGHGAPTTSEFE